MDLFTLVGKIVLDAEGFGEKIDSVMSKVESMGSGLQAAGDKISHIGSKLTLGVTAPIMGIGATAIKAAASFEETMSQVSAISGATGADFKKLENLAKEMGETTKFSASQAAEALTYMAMAGWKTDDMLSGLPGIMNLAHRVRIWRSLQILLQMRSLRSGCLPEIPVILQTCLQKRRLMRIQTYP